MTTNLKDSNFSAYHYQLAFQDKFKNICEPLFKLGVKHFIYFKSFQNGKYLPFINNLDYLRVYLENIKENGETFTQQMNSTKKDRTHHYLLPSDINKFDKKDDPIIHLMYDFNMRNSFIIYKGNGKDFIESYAFTGEYCDEVFYSFCLNNITLLHHFCDYFNEKAADLIDCTDQGKLAHFEQQLNFYDVSQEDLLAQKIEKFLQETPIKKVLKISERNIPLSRREVECLEERLSV
jgi:hypothetical protein